MNQISSKFISFVFRHPFAIVAATGIVFLASLAVLPQLRIDNSVDVFFNKKGANYLNFETWKEQFGSDEIIIVALEADDIFVKKNLELIDRLTQSFESLEYVENVTSLTTVNNIIGQEQDFIIERLVEEIPDAPEAMADLKARATRDELYAGNVISKDGRVTAVIVELENVQGENNDHKKKVIEEVFDILRRDVPSDITFHVSGPTVIEHFYAAYMQDDFKAFMPFLFLMIIAVMYLSFRSAKLVALPLLLIVITVAFSMALLHLLGYSVNNVTTIIPPILMAILIAEGVHIIGEGKERCRKNGGDRDYRFLEETMRHLFFPCFLTSITTSVGFWSLATNEIPPVRQLGIVVGFGVLFSLICTFTFLPALAKIWDGFNVTRPVKSNSAAAGPGKIDALLKWIGRINERHYRAVLWVGVAVAALSVWGMCQIKVETSVIEYFKKSSPVYRATSFIEKHLSGVHIINVSLQAGAPDYFQDPQALARIGQVTEFLQTIPEVDKVTSVNDYLKEINKSFHNENPEFYRLPENRAMVSQYALLYGRQDLEDFVDDQWQWATVRVRLKEHSTVKLAGVIERIQDYVSTQFGDLEAARVVGQTVLEVESNNTVADGQISSLGSAMFGVFLMMFVALRSIPVGIISVIPNVLPLIINFGIMGFFGIRLDSATSMIAAIAIGIVVDDTIHFLFGFGEALEETNDYAAAMYRTLEQRGRPIIETSAILFFGFGILSVSKFVPTSYFGLLSSLLMLYALIAELFLTPSLILCFKPSFKSLNANPIRFQILNLEGKNDRS